MGDSQWEDDIDTELAQSIERLVEEETSEAEATLKSHKPQEEKSVDIVKTQVMPSAGDIDKHIAMMNTMRVPDREKAADSKKVTDSEKAVDNKKSADNKNIKKPVSEKKNTINKKTAIIAFTACVCLIAVVTVVCFILVSRQSYRYNHDRVIELYSQNNFESALSYFKKAYGTSDGAHDIDMIYDMYVCYTKAGDEITAIDILNQILLLDRNNSQAIQSLAQYYSDKKDGAALNSLIESYQGTDAIQYLKGYQPSVPQPSEVSGSYSEPLELTFETDDDTDVYYTMDGTKADINSTHYNGKIALQEGTTKLSVVAVNAIGVKSDVAEFEYVITYKRTAAPEISPASGTYRSGEKIVITAEDDAVIYYTLDGTTPSRSSPVYSGEIEMPEGNSIVSAIAVNKYDVVSAVTRRNYIVQATRNVTYEEALSILKSRMERLNILSSDGEHLTNGQSAAFEYQSAIVVDDVEMYYIKCTIQSDTQQISYYGVGMQNGECYRITGSENSYTATAY
jgi:hypothetical protein